LGVPLELTPPACTFPWVVATLQTVGYWGDSRKGFTAVSTELGFLVRSLEQGGFVQFSTL